LIRFAHIADCHLGGWDDTTLSLLNQMSFEQCIDSCIKEKVDFVIIAGDLFDTARPSIEILEFTGRKLKQLQDHEIPVYLVSGSHDYSATGKTMLNVFESVGMIKRVDIGKGTEQGLSLQMTTDEKTGVKLVGMPGRKGSLEIDYFNDLDRESLEQETGFKIFVFHSAIQEFRPVFFEKMAAVPLSLFPKHFQYYAGGHIHQSDVFKDHTYGVFGFPGALFPNNFRELEKYHHGSFLIVNVENNNITVDKREIPVAPVLVMSFDAQNKTPVSLTDEMIMKINETDVADAVILLRVGGVLSSGRVTEVDFRKIKNMVKEQGAMAIRLNTSKLSTQEYEEIHLEEASSKKELEDMLIDEHVKSHKLLDYTVEERVELTKQLFNVLAEEQKDGETKKDYQQRIVVDAATTLGITKLVKGLYEDH
jgi:DNA repair protein SbcD/Mre11